MDCVVLDFQPGVNWVYVRELCGHDEQMVAGTGTVMAIWLLDRLLLGGNGDGTRPVEAIKMTAADRDKVLGAVFVRAYGPKVESSVRCRQCNSQFDLDFSLTDLQASLNEGTRQSTATREPDDNFSLTDGCRYRLPTGEDECAVLGMSPETATEILLRRCLLGGDPAPDGEKVQTAMAEMAPVLDVDLSARCPECGHEQAVHFDIQSFLLKALEQEKTRLSWEVHRLACAYGWSLGEILGLPRSLRRTHVALVESDFPSRRRFSV